MQRLPPLRLMILLFVGLTVSLTYGLLSLALLLFLGDASEALLFFAAYTSSFKTIISLGLILGTTLIVYSLQNIIPQTIEEVFTGSQLSETDYSYYKRRYASLRISLTFSAQFIVVAFIIFSYCQFPLSGRGEVLMVIAACAEYAFAVYVGRKLMYSGMMLRSLMEVTVTRNLFQKRELDAVNAYVNITSALAIIFVYIHVKNYYEGPFLYSSILGQSIKTFLILPTVIASPILLIFNFYPRSVLRRLYSQSIDVETKSLRRELRNEALSPYEKRSYLIEFNKMSRDELRYRLQLTVSDLTIIIIILIMVLESLLKI